jgi:hypothetical protein
MADEIIRIHPGFSERASGARDWGSPYPARHSRSRAVPRQLGHTGCQRRLRVPRSPVTKIGIRGEPPSINQEDSVVQPGAG